MPFKLQYRAALERSQSWLRTVLHTQQNIQSREESISMNQERIF
jgi:hypothetical protein